MRSKDSFAAVEQLEQRIALSVSAFEQEFVYLLNRARHDPVAYQTERGLSISLGSITPRQPLALNLQLATAGKFKSDEMATLNYFQHTSVTGETPNALVRRFGYDLPERVTVGGTTYVLPATGNQVESLAGGHTTPAAALQGLIESTGHRNHLLGVTAHNQVAQEVGIGYRFRDQAFYKHYWTVLITPSTAPRPFLTGVAFADGNNNTRFEGVEGLGNVTVTASGPNGSFTTTTGMTGGWALSVPSGDYVVTASGGGFSGTSSAPVRVGSQNVAVDFISGSSAATVSFAQHVNSAPLLISSGVRTLAPVVAGTVNPRGQTVGDLLGMDFSDVDPLSPKGIAVTATTVASGGNWQFSMDGGTSWQPLGSPSAGAARLLRSTDMLRFVPGNSAPATASLSYRAWDQSTGSAGGIADTASAGGSTAFSAATATANIHVVSSNTAPVLSSAGTNLFHSVAEDTPDPLGSPVRHLVGSGFSDSDPGTPVGISVIDATGGRDGDWQYSRDDGATWSVLGPVSNSASLLLSGNDRLRFLPVADYNGTVTLTFRAWDASAGGAGDRVDLSGALAVGGSTAFSTAAVTASLTVTPVNDAPVFTAGASALRLRPVPANATQQQALGIGTRVGDLLGNANRDIDASPLRGIAIIGTGGNGTFWWNTGSGSWSTIAAGPNFATLLRDTDYIYFQPSSGFSGTSTLTFRLWDRTSGTQGYNGANLSNPATSTGGSTAFGTEILEARVSVGAAGTPPSATFGNPTRGQNGQAVASIPLSSSRAVSGLDPGDLTLSRDGTPVPLLGTRINGSSTSFNVAGLEAATTVPGTYVLRLVAAGSGITDEAGNPVSGDASATFVVEPSLTAPSAPANLSASGGNAQASLTWTAPSSNGGAAITDYIVQYSSNSGNTWATFSRSASTATSATVTGLDNSTAYIFRVAAVNSAGTGEYSTPSNAVVLNRPPTDIALSPNIISENAGANAVVGTLTTTDPDGGTTFTYTLVTGTGSTDNAVFNISGNQLRASASLDFEIQSSRSVRVRSTDQGGLFTEKALMITVIDVNEPPTAVSLSPAATNLLDDNATNERVKLSDITVTDDGLGTYSLSLGGPDATSFEIIGTALYLRAGVLLDGLSKPSYSVTVEASDPTLPVSPQTAAFSLSVIAGGIQVPGGQTIADSTVRSGDYRLIKRGLGVLILDQANTHFGGTIVEAGEVIVRNPLAFGSGALVIQAGAKLTLDIGTRRVSLPAMTIAGTGTVDLGMGSVALAASSYDLAALRSMIVAGRNNGAWTGTGITSKSVRGVPFREVGYRVLPDGSAIVGFSAVGDSNMDGFVNVQDLIALNAAGKYGSVASNTNWWEGDFNYDGLGNINDLIALLSSGLYGRSSYSPLNSAAVGVLSPTESPTLTEASALSAVPPSVTLTGDAAPARQTEPGLAATSPATARAPEPHRIDRFTWAAIANQGETEKPADRKTARWRIAGR